MKALITGASSGLGRDIARVLDGLGHELILVARRENRLRELSNELAGSPRIIIQDISTLEGCMALYELVREEQIDVLINNAGFGVFGAFDCTDLDKELQMIRTNVEAPHILTKLFLKSFISRDSGYILNVSSASSFYPGPYMAAYYASKAYILHLTQAVGEELRRQGSHVYIGAFCPGPIHTEFDEKANCRFQLQYISSRRAAEYAVERMLRRQGVIVPGVQMKAFRFFRRFLPDGLVVRLCACIQAPGCSPEPSETDRWQEKPEPAQSIL